MKHHFTVRIVSDAVDEIDDDHADTGRHESRHGRDASASISAKRWRWRAAGITSSSADMPTSCPSAPGRIADAVIPGRGRSQCLFGRRDCLCDALGEQTRSSRLFNDLSGRRCFKMRCSCFRGLASAAKRQHERLFRRGHGPPCRLRCRQHSAAGIIALNEANFGA